MNRAARAVEFAGPRRVGIVDVTLPPVAGGDVVVRTLFSGISSGTELLAYRGEIDPSLPLDESLGSLGGTFAYPFRYGYSCVGVVEAGGQELADGALVFAFHPHQDRFVAPASSLVPLGPVAPRAATLFPMVETALQITIEVGELTTGTTVVCGLGVVGLLTSILLQREGISVVAVDPVAWRCDIARTLGIDACAPERVGAVLAGRGLDGVPLVIEASGNPAALADGLALLQHEGTVLVASWYGTTMVPLPLGAAFHRRRLTIRSTQVTSIPASLQGRWTVERRRLEAGARLRDLPLDAIATHTVPFEAVAEAFAALDRRDEGLLHVALGYT
jgi:2-desacetyl-2-hydroxyethyl bacteriochlorophyllide A dehydrogenase